MTCFYHEFLLQVLMLVTFNLGMGRAWKPPGTGGNVGLIHLVGKDLALSCLKSSSSFTTPHQRRGGMSPCYFRVQEIVKRSRCTGRSRASNFLPLLFGVRGMRRLTSEQLYFVKRSCKDNRIVPAESCTLRNSLLHSLGHLDTAII